MTPPIDPLALFRLSVLGPLLHRNRPNHAVIALIAVI